MHSIAGVTPYLYFLFRKCALNWLELAAGGMPAGVIVRAGNAEGRLIGFDGRGRARIRGQYGRLVWVDAAELVVIAPPLPIETVVIPLPAPPLHRAGTKQYKPNLRLLPDDAPSKHKHLTSDWQLMVTEERREYKIVCSKCDEMWDTGVRVGSSVIAPAALICAADEHTIKLPLSPMEIKEQVSFAKRTYYRAPKVDTKAQLALPLMVAA